MFKNSSPDPPLSREKDDQQFVMWPNVQLPADKKASRYFHSMEYSLARDEQVRVLNPYQSAYLLLDNGRASDDDGQCVQSFRAKFDEFLGKAELG